MCNRRVPVDMCVKMSVPATRDHLPRGDTLAPDRQCPLVAGTTVLYLNVHPISQYLNMHPISQYLNVHPISQYLNVHPISQYSRTPLIRPPSESHWCGRVRGMVAREGFVYTQNALSVTRNVVV